MKIRVSLRDPDLGNDNDCAINGEFSVLSPFTSDFTGLRPYNVVSIRGCGLVGSGRVSHNALTGTRKISE